MTDIAYSQTLAVLAHGVYAVPLTLVYRVADPLAAGVELHCGTHRHCWDVSREVLARGLWPGCDVMGYLEECAGQVQCSALPGADRALLVLRDATGRWPLLVPAAGLRDFLGATYRMCPPIHEHSIIDAALDAQLQFLRDTQGNQR